MTEIVPDRNRSPAGLASRRSALKTLAAGGAAAIAGGIPLTLGTSARLRRHAR